MPSISVGRSCASPLLLVAMLPVALCRGEIAQWSEPSIDTWFYNNSVTSGSRLLSPSFAGLELDSVTEQFVANSQSSPARLGSTLVAFETIDQIPAGLEPSRYALSSATITARSQVGGFLYENVARTQNELLNEALGAGITERQPIELFGVGFRDGYVGFDLGLAAPGARFSESDPTYSGSGYVAYPVIGDGAGSYQDVSNSYSGGFSETAIGNQTAPFDATPWAIGTAPLNAGQTVNADATFTFDIDLGLPGARAYLQQSLADGAIGFFLSSMHPAGFQGAGGGAYPQWYMKEAVGLFANAEAATLSLDFAILPIAGDYDGDGVVTHADYDSWTTSFGQAVAPAGMGADGNRDGVVDIADYTVWRDNLPDTLSARGIPEPSAAFCGGLSLLAISRRRQR